MSDYASCKKTKNACGSCSLEGPAASAPEPLLGQSDFYKGLAFHLARKEKEAIACLKKALIANPKYKEALNLLGQSLADAGQYLQGVYCLREALKLDPNYALGYYDLGTLLAKKNNQRKEALCCFEIYLCLPSGDCEMIPWALYSIACLHSLSGRTKEALYFFQHALDYGFNDREHVDKDTDLDQLRSEPYFIKLVEKYLPEVKKA